MSVFAVLWSLARKGLANGMCVCVFVGGCLLEEFLIFRYELWKSWESEGYLL